VDPKGTGVHVAADEAAADREEGFMDLVAAVVADKQSLEVM